MSLQIDATNTDDVIRALRASRAPDISVGSVSLGASIELALWEFHNCERDGCICTWAEMNPLLRHSLNLIKRDLTQAVQPFEERNEEFYALNGATDLSGLLWGQFLSRFAAAIRRAGLPQLSQALAGVLHDLADNIGQHSRIGEPSRFVKGVAAYAVTDRRISFAVGDDGVGALASLKTNRDWAYIESDREAILAIACDHASRRQGQGDGQGYKNLFTVLARLNGYLRFRSGTGIFELRGALDKLKPIGGVGPHIPGLQLAVECNF